MPSIVKKKLLQKPYISHKANAQSAIVKRHQINILKLKKVNFCLESWCIFFFKDFSQSWFGTYGGGDTLKVYLTRKFLFFLTKKH